MKELFKYFFKKKFVILIGLITFFLIGCLTTHFVDKYNSFYQADFTVNNAEYLNVDKLESVDYLNSIKESGYNSNTNTNKYENINVEKMIKNNDFKLINNEDGTYSIKTGYRYYDLFFFSSKMTVSTRAKTFVKDALTKLDSDNLIITWDDPNNIVRVCNSHNKWVVGAYSSLAGLIVILSILSIAYYKKFDKEDEFVYDNINTFKTIFHKEYWKSCVSSLKSVKSITTLAMLFALMLACKFIPIPSGFGNLGISFTYLFFSIVGMIFGPIVAFVVGIFSDTIGFFINSTGMFFPGYTLQAALTGFIYGVCFYKTKVDYSKALIARIFVNMLMNVVLGSICYTMVFTEFKCFSSEFNSFLWAYIKLYDLPKNLVYLLPQSLLLFVVIKSVSPILYHFKFIDKEVYKHIKLFN